MKAKTPELVKFSTYRYTPWFADTKFDVMYLTVNHDLASFAATTTAWQTSVEGPKSDAAIAAVETCKSGLWMGHVLVAPAPPPKM